MQSTSTPRPDDPAGIERRAFLLRGGTALAAGLLWQGGIRAQESAPAAHKLPPLPYPTSALEPHIDARTMEIHHDKHHAAYVNNLNTALAKHPDLQKKPLEELLRDWSKAPEGVRDAIRNQGGGHYNHTLFWSIMGPQKGGEPRPGKLAEAINRTFGGFAGFKQQFSEAAAKQFGSGWAWLVARQQTLQIMALPNQDSPIMQAYTPLLGIDVWEHAYYLKYQNRRPEYIAAWWNVVNWDEVEKRFSAAAAS